jgi:hypothetical protein
MRITDVTAGGGGGGGVWDVGDVGKDRIPPSQADTSMVKKRAPSAAVRRVPVMKILPALWWGLLDAARLRKADGYYVGVGMERLFNTAPRS